MSSILPPQPSGVPPGHAFWNAWYQKLRDLINNMANSIQWVNLNFTGSKITDIVDRKHNDLQSFQGGTTSEYYHLTSAQHTRITALANPDITGQNNDMTVQPKVVAINTNGGTLTLKASDTTGTGIGGPVQISAGSASAAAGGTVNINAGDGTAGGQFYFTAGNGSSTTGGDFNVVAGNGNTNGGSVFLTSGSTTGAGNAGDVYISSGAGNTTGGAIYLQAGLASSPSVSISDDGTNPKLGFYGVSPITIPTTGGAAAAFTANIGTPVNDASTFDGYTIKQVVKALRNLGLLQ